jgi:hypothetical protein
VAAGAAVVDGGVEAVVTVCVALVEVAEVLVPVPFAGATVAVSPT